MRRITKKSLVAFVAISMVAAGCQTTQQSRGGGANPQLVGGLVGAAAGAALGSRFGQGTGRTGAVIAGAILGGLAGSAIAQNMTREDHVYHQQTQTQALDYAEPYQPVRWQNPNTGHYGEVMPTTPVYRATTQEECREYKQTIWVEGHNYETATGTACRRADGTWRIVS